MAARAPGAAPAPPAAGAGQAPKVTLYVIGGSHACSTAKLTLRHKRIAYRTVTLPTGLHPLGVRLLGFPGHPKAIRTVDGTTHGALARLDHLGTVPALRWEGQRIQTNGAIAEFLDRVVPEPPLYPADPRQREAVEEAVRFGDEPLQMAARRTVLAAGAGGLDKLHNQGGSGRLGALLAGNTLQRRMVSEVAARLTFRAAGRDEQLLDELTPMLDQLDEWKAEGLIGGKELNAADFAIAPSLALLDYRLDLREDLRRRPCFALVERLLPEPAA